VLSANGSVKSYRYLRLSVVGLAVLLAVSVVIAYASGDRGLGSISAYYYTPVRSVLVGALVGMGLALIAIKGRDQNHEDVLLNLAGMLAPVVAFVPTPLHEGQVVNEVPVDCPGEAVRCVPEEFVAGVDNNVVALAIVAALGLGLGWWMARRDGPLTGRARFGLLAAAAVVVSFVLVFVVGHDAFLVVAHYASAVPMFGALVVVMAINARQSRSQLTMRGRAVSYAPLYRALWVGMAGALGLAGLYLLLVWLTPLTPWVGWIFLLEAVLLALFTVFWVLQTAEWYDEGVPDETDAAAPA
jgi:hypothetical protein